mmetsp:Transcript_16003/g.18578  ORF Transcript_16003/g.18578 Transcript_16003/m.18578 type:complete len:172 (+) Transcript_16003:505-1020(+)
MWIAGLRGAMAYALALESFKDYSTGKVMLVITLIYSLFSVLIIGSCMGLILKLIGVEKTEEDLQTQIEIDESFYGGGTSHLDRVTNCGERFKMELYQFNEKYFRPIFIVDKLETENVADGLASELSQAEKPKRKSDSRLFELNLEGNRLQHKSGSELNSSEPKQGGHRNSF